MSAARLNSRALTVRGTLPQIGSFSLEKRRPLGEFHARMKEVEEGLYRAEYSGEINPENSDHGTFLTATWVRASLM